MIKRSSLPVLLAMLLTFVTIQAISAIASESGITKPIIVGRQVIDKQAQGSYQGIWIWQTL